MGRVDEDRMEDALESFRKEGSEPLDGVPSVGRSMVPGLAVVRNCVGDQNAGVCGGGGGGGGGSCC